MFHLMSVTIFDLHFIIAEAENILPYYATAETNDMNFQADYIPFEEFNGINETMISEDQIFSVDPTRTDVTLNADFITFMETFLAADNNIIEVQNAETFDADDDAIFEVLNAETFLAEDDAIIEVPNAETFVADDDTIIPNVPNAKSFPIYNFNIHNRTLELYQNIKIENLHDDDTVIENVYADEVVPVKMHLFYCKECDKSFHKSGPYMQHINARHKGGNRMKCKICGKHFPSTKVLNEHLIKHRAESKTYQCNICIRAYVHKVDLKRHMMSHEPKSNKPYHCVTCGKGFVRIDHLKNHEASHDKKKIRLQNLVLMKNKKMLIIGE